MYQSIHYDFLNKIYHLRDDKEGWSEFKYQPTYYQYYSHGEYTTLEGKKCTPTKKYDKDDIFLLEKDVDKKIRVLVDTYFEDDSIPSYHNVVFLDIENEIAGQLTEETVINAPTKITSIALYDTTLKKYFCFILDSTNKINSSSNTSEVISCISEEILLSKFLNKWEELDPTIVSGWNSEFFDIPYLYHRIRKVLGEQEALRLSPVRKVKSPYDHKDEFSYKQWKKKVEDKRKGFDRGETLTYTEVLGINHLDYMLLFKKFIVKQEASYKLDEIGKKYVSLGKVEYEGSLDKLFKEDINKFIDYNIRDVEILVKLEEKLKFIDLTVAIAHLCHVPYESIYYSTVMNEGAILTYLKRKNVISPNKPTTVNPDLKIPSEDDAYAGGYLKEPDPGLYEWVIDLDFTSLYPSIIRSLNLGVETLVCRIVGNGKYDNNWSLQELKAKDPEELVTIEKITEDRKLKSTKIAIKKLIALIESENILVAASGALFRTDISSVVCDILSDWFQKRVEYKRLMKKAYKEDKDPVKGEFYNRLQHAYKIKLNDVYGVYAINGWRYTDGHKIISSAITLTGQRVTQESIKFVNKWMNERLGTGNKDYVVTSDTDSLFIQVKDLALKMHPELAGANKEEWIKVILNIANEIQKEANNNLNKLVVDLFNINDRPHFFELKQEVIIERGYFAGKRRYAQYIVNKEGMPVDELDMKGLDLMKSNFPKVFRDFGEKILKDIMFGKPKPEIDKQIISFKDSIKSFDWKQVSKPTGLKKLDEYISSGPKPGEIFSRLALKCPINTKAAIYYNDLLKFKSLDNKYAKFQTGDKMYIAYLKNNPYKIECIGFNGYNDPEEIENFIKQYLDSDKIFESVMKNKLESLYEDLKWGKPIFNKSVNKFFSFT